MVRQQKVELKEWFHKRGFLPAKAEIWAEFISQALEIYWQAADQLLEPSYWKEFLKKQGALSVPKHKKKLVIRIPNEDAITSEIGFLVEEISRNLASYHILRRYEAQFAFEALVQSKTRAGRYSKTVDFRVLSNFPNYPELAMEAKPLTSVADIKGRYFSEEGMGCFFTADAPYTKGPLGAMWAYTITEALDSMQEEILAQLKLQNPAAIHIQRVAAIGAREFDCSFHERTTWNLQPISILHLERRFPVHVPVQSEIPKAVQLKKKNSKNKLNV